MFHSWCINYPWTKSHFLDQSPLQLTLFSKQDFTPITYCQYDTKWMPWSLSQATDWIKENGHLSGTVWDHQDTYNSAYTQNVANENSALFLWFILRRHQYFRRYRLKRYENPVNNCKRFWMNWPCMTELVSRHLPGKTEKKKNT